MHEALPGGDLIEKGLTDLRAGRETVEGLLVAIGAPRLRTIGLKLPDNLPENPEHRLYDLLAKDDSDSAHSRYNAWIRKLIVFEHTGEHALNSPSPNSDFRKLVDGIVSVDFVEGASAIRNSLQRLQLL
ncbi:MAG: hypothetical protein ACT4OT_10735 [Acidobacteriota bacterium]